MLRRLIGPGCFGLLLLSAAGCSAIPGTAENQAGSLAAKAAERAHLAVENLPGRPPLENMEHAVATYGDVMSAEGEEWDGGAVIVLRTTGRSPGVGGSEVSSTRCFRLVFRKGTSWDQSTHETTCPDGDPVALPDVVEPRRLPDGALDTVKTALAPMAGTGVEASEVKAVLEAALPGVAIDVATQGDVIGVAGLVAGPMLRDCVYARLSPAGVEAWVPPHVYEQAGETSCTGGEAFSDFTRHGPH